MLKSNIDPTRLIESTLSLLGRRAAYVSTTQQPRGEIPLKQPQTLSKERAPKHLLVQAVATRTLSILAVACTPTLIAQPTIKSNDRRQHYISLQTEWQELEVTDKLQILNFCLSRDDLLVTISVEKCSNYT